MDNQRPEKGIPLEYSANPCASERPLWNDVVLAVGLTLASLILLPYGLAAWYAQVFGEADVGGLCVWVLVILAFATAWKMIQQWRTVWRRVRIG